MLVICHNNPRIGLDMTEIASGQGGITGTDIQAFKKEQGAS